MLDHAQISGIEIQDILMSKGINLNLSVKPNNNERILNWCRLVRYFGKLNVFIKPEQVANIIRHNDIEYHQLMQQMLVAIEDIEESSKLDERNVKKLHLDIGQHEFIHSVKRIIKFGTKLKLPYLKNASYEYNAEEICPAVDKSSNLSNVIKRYASQSSIFDVPPVEAVIERKDSKHLNITSPFSQDQIDSLHQLMIQDFKKLLSSEIQKFMQTSSVDESNLSILNEKTEYEAVLSKRFKESQQVKQRWREIEMDAEFELKQMALNKEIKIVPITINEDVKKISVTAAIDKYYETDLLASLRCLILGCIEIAQFRGSNAQGLVIEREVKNRIEHVIEHPAIVFEKINFISYNSFVNSACYKGLELYKDLIFNFNNIPTVTETFKMTCCTLIFTTNAVEGFYCVDFNQSYAMDKEILILYNAPINNQGMLTEKTIEFFKKYIQCNLQLATDSLYNELSFYIYVPLDENVDNLIKLSNIRMHTTYKIIHDLNIVPKNDKSFSKTNFNLDLPLIDEFYAAYTQVTQDQVSALFDFNETIKEFYLNLTAYSESSKAFLTLFFGSDMRLCEDYNSTVLVYNREEQDARLSAEFKNNYQLKFYRVLLDMWSRVDEKKDSNKLQLQTLFSTEWKLLLLENLKGVYFKYLSHSLEYFMSVNLLFTEMKKAFNGEYVGQLNFEVFKTIVTVDNFLEKTLEYVNALKPKKVEKKKTQAYDELLKFIQFQDTFFTTSITEYKQTIQGVEDYILVQINQLTNDLSAVHGQQTKYVDELSEIAKYCIEAELPISNK